MISFEFEYLNIFSAIFPSFFNLQNIVTVYLQDLHKEDRYIRVQQHKGYYGENPITFLQRLSPSDCRPPPR